MKKPEPGVMPRPVPSGPRGRFVGVVGVGKELYQVHLLETVGEAVVKRTVLAEGRLNKLNGKDVRGEGLAVTRANVNTANGKYLSELTDLWADAK